MQLLTTEQARKIIGKEINFFSYSKNNNFSYSGICVITKITGTFLCTDTGYFNNATTERCSLSGKIVYNYNKFSQSIFYKLKSI
tara:strand:- start:5265 stop:5516 length:252 start_codon:yes stop_codon:yes gene_type:complete